MAGHIAGNSARRRFHLRLSREWPAPHVGLPPVSDSQTAVATFTSEITTPPKIGLSIPGRTGSTRPPEILPCSSTAPMRRRRRRRHAKIGFIFLTGNAWLKFRHSRKGGATGHSIRRAPISQTCNPLAKNRGAPDRRNHCRHDDNFNGAQLRTSANSGGGRAGIS